jgi:hypothetical protein
MAAETKGEGLMRAAILTREEILHVVGEIIDAWCERRCLGALRSILRAYPLASGSPEEWGALAEALREVARLSASELTAAELQSLDRLAGAVELSLRRA